MNLISERNFVYVGTEERISQKSGNKYKLIKIADPLVYENYDFFVTDNLVLPNDLTLGEKVKVIFDLSKRGYANNLNLKELKKV